MLKDCRLEGGRGLGGVLERIGGGGRLLFVKEVVICLEGDLSSAVIISFFVVLLGACFVWLGEGLQAGLELPVCHLLDIIDEIGDLFPLFEALLVVGTASA